MTVNGTRGLRLRFATRLTWNDFRIRDSVACKSPYPKNLTSHPEFTTPRLLQKVEVFFKRGQLSDFPKKDFISLHQSSESFYFFSESKGK